MRRARADLNLRLSIEFDGAATNQNVATWPSWYALSQTPHWPRLCLCQMDLLRQRALTQVWQKTIALPDNDDEETNALDENGDVESSDK